MESRTLEDRIRQKAREAFKAQCIDYVDAVKSLIKNPSAVKGVTFAGKDITNLKLLETLVEHIVETQSVWVEEQALDAFMGEIEDQHADDPQKFPFLSGE